MAVSIYTPPSTKIVHWTGVDFVSRPSAFPPIHLVQYDRKLPIIAVNLYNNGKSYSIPSNVSVNVLVEKKDGTFVSNPVLGCNSDRTVVYFEATYQMLYYFGTIKPVIELKMSDNEVGSSSAITVIVDRNPVQEKGKESSNEYKSIEQFVNQALDAKNQAINAKNQTIDIKNQAASYANSANQSKNSAAQFASNAFVSEQNAKDYLMTIEAMSIMDPAIITDSDGNPITDSNGNNILGVYQFATSEEIRNILYQISVLSNKSQILDQKLTHLTEHAILDSYY